jgi:hypothetical protein
VRAVSKKRAKAMRENSTVREAVFFRDNRDCVLAADAERSEVPPCRGPLTPHHRRKASSGGAYTMANLVSLCAWHNDDLEDHPWRYDIGTITNRHGWLVVREGDAEFESLGIRAQRAGIGGPTIEEETDG